MELIIHHEHLTKVSAVRTAIAAKPSRGRGLAVMMYDQCPNASTTTNTKAKLWI